MNGYICCIGGNNERVGRRFRSVPRRFVFVCCFFGWCLDSLPPPIHTLHPPDPRCLTVLRRESKWMRIFAPNIPRKQRGSLSFSCSSYIRPSLHDDGQLEPNRKNLALQIGPKNNKQRQGSDGSLVPRPPPTAFLPRALYKKEANQNVYDPLFPHTSGTTQRRARERYIIYLIYKSGLVDLGRFSVCL
jgi:hypothetical protein